MDHRSKKVKRSLRSWPLRPVSSHAVCAATTLASCYCWSGHLCLPFSQQAYSQYRTLDSMSCVYALTSKMFSHIAVSPLAHWHGVTFLPEPAETFRLVLLKWGPINKQLQERKTYQAELLHDGGARNFWFHSLLQERTGGHTKQQSLSHGHTDTHTGAHAQRPAHTLLFFVYLFFLFPC